MNVGKYLFLISILVSSTLHAGEMNSSLSINLEKRASLEVNRDPQAQWFVSYVSQKSISKIFFNNSSNHSRARRWSATSTDFEIISDGEHEIIQRKDKGEFNRVEFKLTPSYTHLPKNYAPFSPFSDGGMAIHTGRFFACIDTCDKTTKSWDMFLSVPKGQHIIIDGQINSDSINWADGVDGKSIYIGQQKPIETAGTLSLIDPGLPSEIKNSFNRDIPKLMNYFEKKLGVLTTKDKPTLFASYAKVDGTSTQGGTLPNQVFMHWNHDDLNEKVHDKTFLLQTLFYFAHEVAHLFQLSATIPSPDTQAWIHEGSADFFALEALSALYPESQNFIAEKQLDSQKRCEASLEKHALTEASAKGDFKMHYYCGLLMHQRIAKELKLAKEPINLSDLWQVYRQEVKSGKEAGQNTFLEILRKYGSDDFVDSIDQFINTKPKDPNLALSRLAA